MKQKTNASIFLALLMTFVLFACNNEQKADEPAAADTASTTASSMPAYDAAMDPVTVEGKYAKLHADSLGIKLYEVTLQPGDSVGMHTHPDNAIYVVEGGTGVLTLKDGSTQAVEFVKGMGILGGPTTHSGKNTGTTTIKLLVADIYRPRN